MKVYFIGAGPGDPELITVKGKNIIKKADLIIYAGSLVSKKILRFSKRSARCYDSSGMSLDEVTSLIRKMKPRDSIVVRIHSGDPSIYGAIQEQMDWCDRQKIEYEVIPGVSSFQAAAAALKREFTLPGVSQTVILTRIPGRTDVPKKEDLRELSKSRPTMVIFLSISAIERVAAKLKKNYSLDTPVVVIEKVSFPDERKIFGTLRTIAQKIKESGIKRQALIIIGDVLRKDYQKSKLYDKNFAHSFRKKRR